MASGHGSLWSPVAYECCGSWIIKWFLNRPISVSLMLMHVPGRERLHILAILWSRVSPLSFSQGKKGRKSWLFWEKEFVYEPWTLLRYSSGSLRSHSGIFVRFLLNLNSEGLDREVPCHPFSYCHTLNIAHVKCQKPGLKTHQTSKRHSHFMKWKTKSLFWQHLILKNQILRIIR